VSASIVSKLFFIWIFVYLGRFVSISRAQQACFIQSKTVLMIISGVTLFWFLLNFHFFPFGCSFTVSDILSVYLVSYNIYPLWEYIHLDVYFAIPFLSMLVFNSTVNYFLFKLKHDNMTTKSCIEQRSITITRAIMRFFMLRDESASYNHLCILLVG
jgi:hypothetical protein